MRKLRQQWLSALRVESIRVAVVGVNENYGDVAKIRNLFIKGGWDHELPAGFGSRRHPTEFDALVGVITVPPLALTTVPATPAT